MTPAVAAVLWALAATLTAFLPMRAQMLPGLALLVAAPGLVAWIGLSYGWLWTLPAGLAFVSMFRRPLGHLAARLNARLNAGLTARRAGPGGPSAGGRP